MSKVVARAAWDYDREAASVEAGLDFGDEPTLTQQHQKEDADINTIVRRFGITGELPVIPMPPLNEEFVDVFDFHEAQNLIARANQSFNMLPADVRNRFGNDPARFVDFCSDEGNISELRKMGLAVPEAASGEAVASQGAGAGTPAPAAPPEGGAKG